MVDHCISLFQKEQKEKALINYITTGLKYISENVAYCGNVYGADGKHLTISYEDMFEAKEEEEVNAEDIVEDVMTKCGFLGG